MYPMLKWLTGGGTSRVVNKAEQKNTGEKPPLYNRPHITFLHDPSSLSSMDAKSAPFSNYNNHSTGANTYFIRAKKQKGERKKHSQVIPQATGLLSQFSIKA